MSPACGIVVVTVTHDTSDCAVQTTGVLQRTTAGIREALLNDVEPARAAGCADVDGGRAHRVETSRLQHAYVLSRGRRRPPDHDYALSRRVPVVRDSEADCARPAAGLSAVQGDPGRVRVGRPGAALLGRNRSCEVVRRRHAGRELDWRDRVLAGWGVPGLRDQERPLTHRNRPCAARHVPVSLEGVGHAAVADARAAACHPQPCQIAHAVQGQLPGALTAKLPVASSLLNDALLGRDVKGAGLKAIFLHRDRQTGDGQRAGADGVGRIRRNSDVDRASSAAAGPTGDGHPAPVR